MWNCNSVLKKGDSILSEWEVRTLYPFSGDWIPVLGESWMTSSSRLQNWKKIDKVSAEDSGIFFC